MLAEKLNMKPEEAECWIVNLIRNARLDAKIDSKLGHVVMGTQPLSPYQQLIEKIDSLSVRSEALQNLIERKLKARTQDVRLLSWLLQCYIFLEQLIETSEMSRHHHTLCIQWQENHCMEQGFVFTHSTLTVYITFSDAI